MKDGGACGTVGNDTREEHQDWTLETVDMLKR